MYYTSFGPVIGLGEYRSHEISLDKWESLIQGGMLGLGRGVCHNILILHMGNGLISAAYMLHKVGPSVLKNMQSTICCITH